MEILENKKNMLVVKKANEIDFISYKTHIATYNKNTKKLVLNGTFWNYSQTTTKQFKEFINIYTCFNYTNKKDFEKIIKNNNDIIIL